MVHSLPVTALVTVRRHPAIAPWSAPECGLHPPRSPIKPPTSSFSLDRSILCLLQRGGGSHYNTSHVCKLPGGAADSVCICALSYSALLLMYPAPFLTHTHRRHALRPPTVTLATLRQIQTLRSKQNQSPPPSSAAESSGARSVPASLFKSGLKRRADLHSTFTFRKKGKLSRNLVNLG